MTGLRQTHSQEWGKFQDRFGKRASRIEDDEEAAANGKKKNLCFPRLQGRKHI
jgi:hypothetical protein